MYHMLLCAISSMHDMFSVPQSPCSECTKRSAYQFLSAKGSMCYRFYVPKALHTLGSMCHKFHIVYSRDLAHCSMSHMFHVL